MLPIHKASIQGLGLGRSVYRRNTNGPTNFPSSASSPQNRSFWMNIINRWLPCLAGAVRKPKFWYIVIALLGLMWLVGSIFYFPVLLVKNAATDEPGGGPHIRSGSKSDEATIYKPGLKSIENEIDTALHDFLRDLNLKFKGMDDPDFHQIWNAYMEIAELHLVPLDKKTINNSGLFPVEENKSIFISTVAYGQDDGCMTMLKDVYSNALHPEKVAVGLVQENFKSDDDDTPTGGEDAVSNSNCYSNFCATDLGKPYCDKKAIRLLQIEERDSLGLNVARYLAAKLWRGENFFFQVDSDFHFGMRWDESLIKDMNATPTYPKSVLSYHPAAFADEEDFNSILEKDAPHRVCGARFPKTTAGPDSNIIYLDIDKEENSAQQQISSEDGKPCPTAFLRSSFVFAHGTMLSTVPFDPFVPWISMGDETVLSLRMWTCGFNFYGPTKSVAGYYPDYPQQKRRKFWENSGHLLNSEAMYVKFTSQLIHRVKHILYYPESSKAQITANNIIEVLIHQEDLYGIGPDRSIYNFLSVAGINPIGKKTNEASWCRDCMPPRDISIDI